MPTLLPRTTPARPTRSLLCLLVGLLGCSSRPESKPFVPVLPETRTAPPADAPNVLLISIDTLRADAIEPYGQARPTAPAMSLLAAEGVVFENSWAQAPSTSPTHASMFTGVWPAEHGIMGTKARLSMHWTTAAEHFYAHGYRTWAVATSVRFAPGVQLHQGFEQYEVFMGEHPVKVGDKAMKVAAREIPSTPDQPWFGFIHLLDVHAPYGVPEPHQSRYLSEPSVLRPDQTVDFIHEHRHDPKAVSDRQLHDLKAMYAGGVSYVDTRIQKLVDAVKAHPRPTVIVLTSDHGEGFFENGYLGHGSRVWDPITRVPLILWAPERLPAGARRTTLAQSIDLFPTMSALAGLPLPDQGRGIDLSPVARGEGEVTGRTVLTQSETHSGVVRDVKGRLFKLVQRYHKDAAHRYVRLYDLTADPGEQLAVGSRNPQLRDALKAYAAEHHRSAFKAQREAWARSAEEDQMLKEIGYME